MQNTNKNILIGIVAAALIAGGAWFLFGNQAHPLPVAEGDAISSWDFQGSYEGNSELEKRARDEIARSEGLLGGDQSGANDDPTDYILYVSIANQYELLGDGKAAYEYLGRALRIDSTKTGLAWRNLGALMERLGALNTARIAYARAVEAQSQIAEYHTARIQFLIAHFAEDTAAIEAAFGEAEVGLEGTAPEIQQIKAQWYESIGMTQEAIEALREMERLMGGNVPTIRGEIARLRAS
ncbi:hypothetical protein HYW60_01335 [Candidatus Kaiserbacteria bacterium]|nr:hypothetical protein [Candidatus Kaiserbacteria bacterium]